MNHAKAIGFDVYGTLVDPLAVGVLLEDKLGKERAAEFSGVWRQKQLEYSFRRGLMKSYEDFLVCTKQALEFAVQFCELDLTVETRQSLIDQYQHLEPYPEVIQALRSLRAAGFYLTAFSNGPESMVRDLLANSDVLPELDDVISVDDLQTFKPNPAVYHYLSQRTSCRASHTWLVSSNAWDVIGAKSAGLRAAWIKRSPKAVFDPWGVEPDLVAPELESVAKCLEEFE